MENIKLFLSNQILVVFQALYPNVVIDHSLLEVLYFGKFNTDYKVKSLIAVQKALQGINVSVTDLGNQLAAAINPNNFTCIIDRNALNINLKNEFVRKQIQNMYKNNVLNNNLLHFQQN